MRVRIKRAIALGLALAVAGCTGTESPGTAQATPSESSGKQAEEWKLVGTVKDKTVYVDVASLTTRGDTVGMRARITRDGDTTMQEADIACATQQMRRIDRDEWQPVRKGLSSLIAESVCVKVSGRVGSAQ